MVSRSTGKPWHPSVYVVAKRLYENGVMALDHFPPAAVFFEQVSGACAVCGWTERKAQYRPAASFVVSWLPKIDVLLRPWVFFLQVGLERQPHKVRGVF